MRISLCMIVKDEQKFIKMCLDRALPLVDEAIIVDTGSTDNTINIIREYGDKVKVVELNWENDFSRARNIYLENATGDWILVLDADEEIVYNRDKLITYISHAQAEAFNIKMINVIDDQKKQNTWVYCRLFKNKGYRYYRPVHEQLDVDRVKIQTLPEDNCKLFHYGYLNENLTAKNKIERNLSILIEDYKKNPEDSFVCYHIGATYAANGEYGKAMEFLTKSYELGTRFGFGSYYFELVKRLSEVISILGDNKLCVDFILQLLAHDKLKKFTDLYFIIGDAYYKLKDYKRSIEAFNKCLDIGETKEFPSVSGRGSYSSLMKLAKIYRELNEAKLAFDFYGRAYKYKYKLEDKEIGEIEDYCGL